MLGKGVYPYDYMDDWRNFNETSFPEDEDFGSHLNCVRVKRVCKDFEIKNLGKYYDLHVQSNKLLSADVFNNFWNYVSWDILDWSFSFSFKQP